MGKIYIIDDDQDIVDSLSIVLEKDGYEILAQYDDVNVVKNVSDYGPDLIILDVMFPEDASAGFKIARKIKSYPGLKNIPIIMLSAINEKGIYMGRFNDQDLDQSWIPVDKFLDKPVKPQQLLEQVKFFIKG